MKEDSKAIKVVLDSITFPQKIEGLVNATQALSCLSSPMTDILKQMEIQDKLFKESMIGHSLQLAQSYTDLLKSIAEPLSFQISMVENSFQEMVETIRRQSNPFEEALRGVQAVHDAMGLIAQDALRGIADAIKSIPPEFYIRIKLHSEYWLIVDDELMAAIVEDDLKDKEEIIEFIVNYYKGNNWKNIESLISSWEPHIISERFDIFLSSVRVVKQIEDQDVHLLTIPTLIAQIDGLVRDLYAKLPRDTKKRVEKEIREGLPENLRDKRIDVRHEVAVQTVAEMVDFWSAEMLQEVIFSGLFRNSNKINPDESYSLFRHKIMHGDQEYLAYGNEQNFIRLVLYADFIISMIKRIDVEAIEFPEVNQ